MPGIIKNTLLNYVSQSFEIENPVNSKRIFELNDKPIKSGNIIYLCEREIRAKDNFALQFAIKKSEELRIEGGKTTRVEFPLKSCIGNISGKVDVVDDFERNMDTKDFVVVLLDEKGEEKAYSTLDERGEFYLSGIEPGVYFVQLDKNIIEEKNLQNIESKSIIRVEIPYEYKRFKDIKDINLVYSVVSI